jgi:glycosyltransferase involved in cell wall biosynthesis
MSEYIKYAPDLKIDKNSRIFNELLLYFIGERTNIVGKDIYWEIIHQVVINYKCDKLIVFQDIWQMEKYKIDLIPCQKYLWLPVHNTFTMEPLQDNPSFLETRNLYHLTYFDKIATFSQFGVEVLKSFCYDATLINHTIDSTIYRNLNNKKNLRKKYGLNENDFICLMIARNSEDNDRKAFIPQFEAFSLFAKNKPNCKLILHENSTFSLDKGNQNLKEKAIQLGILSKISILDDSFSKNYQINDLYNLSDVLLCGSRSEGFGVPMVEAQFCDLPVITNNCTSMQTNTYFGVAIDPLKTTYTINGYRSWSIPHVDGISKVLEDIYNKDEQKYCFKKIDKEKYSIDNVINDWLKFLNI